MSQQSSAPDPYASHPDQGAGQPSGYGSGDAVPQQYSSYGGPVQYGTGSGPGGQVRGTGMAVLLYIVTFGIYGVYWYYVTHEEMKKHSGEGLGGIVALLLALFVGIVLPFLTSDEVGKLYERRGQSKPVSAATGLWVFPGAFLVFLPIVWFVKTNGALNDYWRSLGAQG